MIKASDLQKVDYAILQYLHKHGKTEVSELARALNKSPKIIELRVDLLATPDRNNRIPVENTSYIDREYRDIVVDGGIDSWEYTGFILHLVHNKMVSTILVTVEVMIETITAVVSFSSFIHKWSFLLIFILTSAGLGSSGFSGIPKVCPE